MSRRGFGAGKRGAFDVQSPVLRGGWVTGNPAADFSGVYVWKLVCSLPNDQWYIRLMVISVIARISRVNGMPTRRKSVLR